MTPPPPPPAAVADPRGPAPRLRRPRGSVLADRGYAILAAAASVVAVVFVAYLLIVTMANTGDLWSTYGVWGFVTGTQWMPTPATGEALYGALPFVYGTLMTSFIALAIAVPGIGGDRARHGGVPAAAAPWTCRGLHQPARRRPVGHLRIVGRDHSGALPATRPRLGLRDLRRSQPLRMAPVRGAGDVGLVFGIRSGTGHHGAADHHGDLAGGSPHGAA